MELWMQLTKKHHHKAWGTMYEMGKENEQMQEKKGTKET